MPTPTPVYVYRATCIKVVDGDTLDLNIDLGCNMHLYERIRLYGINAYELHDKDPVKRDLGLKGKERMMALVRPETQLIVQTYKDKTEKYGRLLGTIYLPDGSTLNQILLDEKLAVVATY